VSDLDRWLDGRMDSTEGAAFERARAGDATLAREVELQARIDASLKRMFAPPASASRLRVASRAREDRAGAVAWIAAAALIAGVSLLGTWLFGSDSLPRAKSTGSALYALALRTRPELDVVACNAEAPLSPRNDACALESSPRVALDPTARDVRRLEPAPSPTAVVLAFDALEPPSVVWIERREKDPRPRFDANDRCRAFRREIGPFVVYEISPASEPRTFGYFSLAR
jgi:hypothetical protein